jgi:hypothetical protein
VKYKNKQYGAEQHHEVQPHRSIVPLTRHHLVLIVIDVGKV